MQEKKIIMQKCFTAYLTLGIEVNLNLECSINKCKNDKKLNKINTLSVIVVDIAPWELIQPVTFRGDFLSSLQHVGVPDV